MMKKLFLALAALVLVLCADARNLKIMSFNIRFGERADMERIAEVIRRERPDLVALQEVDVFTRRKGHVAAGRSDYPAQLAKYTRMNAAFGRAIYFRGGQYGVAILSDFEILESSNDLYKHQGEEARTALSVVVDTGKDGPVRFVCTHLDAYSQAVRLQQIDELCTRYADPAIPTIVAGDFNETPGGAAIARFDATFTRVCGDKPTFPAEEPAEKIDYIGFAPADAFRPGRVRVLDTSEVSDHRALVVRLRFGRD